MQNEIQIDDPIKLTVKLLKYKNDLRGLVDHSKLQVNLRIFICVPAVLTISMGHIFTFFQPGLFDIEDQLRNISLPPTAEHERDNSKLVIFKHVNR